MNRNRTFIRSLLFAAAVPQLAFTQPVIFSVLNAASYSAAISPGSLISILGTNFAAEPLDAPSVSTPTSLGGVSVRFGDLSATLLYVSPNQVNAVIPFGAAGPLVMTSSGGSTTYNLRLTRDAPGIFTQGGAAPLFNANLKQIDAIHPQDVVILYATGLGPIDASGQVVDPVDVFLGERKAKVLSAGLAPGRPGVYQLSLVVPRLATDRLYIRSGGWQSNIVYLSAYSEDFGSVLIPAGNNTTNVNGTIEGLYPSADPSFPHVACIGNTAAVPCGFESFSVTLHAGTYRTSFDIASDATPFDVAAVGEAGSAVISIDPASHTYTASVTTLSMAARMGDFRTSVAPLWDYASCNASGVCLQVPGPNILPASRLPPWWIRAAQLLPSPTVTDPADPNGLFETAGSFTGLHFAIDGENNSPLSNFGGVVQTALGPFGNAFSNFRLYVDGRLVASKSIQYVPAQRCFVTGPVCWQAGNLPAQ